MPNSQTPFRYEIELSGAHEAEAIPTTYTGTDFHGRVKLIFHQDLAAKSFLVKLLYRVTGSGSPETHERFQQRFELTTVKAGQELAKRVLLSVPARAPISYEGAYVKILWAVALELELESGEVFIEEHPVLILPRPAQHEEVEDEGGEESTRSSVRLSNIDLSSALEEPAAPEPAAPAAPPMMLDIMDPVSDIESELSMAVPDTEPSPAFVSGVMDLPDDDEDPLASSGDLGAIAVMPGAMDLPEGEGAALMTALLTDTPMDDGEDDEEEPITQSSDEGTAEVVKPSEELAKDAKEEDDEPVEFTKMPEPEEVDKKVLEGKGEGVPKKMPARPFSLKKDKDGEG